MKRFVLTFFGIGAILLLTVAASAQQQNQNQREATPEDIANAEVVIVANVQARELKFEVVPNTKVEFFGTHERKTVWEADRQNLPRPVEPGVTYRNIGIQLRIVSRFADIERIVAEALGEIPVSDDAPKSNQPAVPTESAQTPDKPQTETEAPKKPQ